MNINNNSKEEIIHNYAKELNDIIVNSNVYHLYNNTSSMELNWYGPIYSGIGHSLQECSEIFFKKIIYSLKKEILNNKFKIEIIIAYKLTRIKYTFLKNKTYEKIFLNNDFVKVKKEINLFNKRLYLLNNINNNIPIYISNRIDKNKILYKSTNILYKISILMLSNRKSIQYFIPIEIIHNIIINMFDIYYL